MSESFGLAKYLAEQRANYEAEREAMRTHIKRLEAALVRIWSWYPTNVSNPHQQINEMKDFAFKVIKEGNEDAKSD